VGYLDSELIVAIISPGLAISPQRYLLIQEAVILQAATMLRGFILQKIIL
jgi:hypothetical protein